MRHGGDRTSAGGGRGRASRPVGLIANPASGRDIRRLVAEGATVTANEKVSVLRRVLAGLAAAGVDRVISMTDRSGISGRLEAMAGRAAAAGWPHLEFVERALDGGPGDTTAATEAMVAAGVGAIVVLGGDGTNRLVAAACADIPLLPISTGTNNAFPRPVEPTVAGLAAGLVATGRWATAKAATRAKVLELRVGDQTELAVVDVAVGRGSRIGTGAVWDPTDVSELFLCFAEPGNIGLSSIGAHLEPVGRNEPVGLHLTLRPSAGPPTESALLVPVGPGLVDEIGVANHCRMRPGAEVPIGATAGLVAIDGERMVPFGPADRPTVTLRLDGPLVIDAAATLDGAARAGLLRRPRSRHDLPPETGPSEREREVDPCQS